MGDIHRLIQEHGLDGARAMAETPNDRLACEAAAAVLADDGTKLGVSHAGFAMTALPHKRIAATQWKRDGGTVRLWVESGIDAEGQPIGVPYGSIARIILLYLQTQAVRSKSREVELGASMNAWLGVVGIPVGGKTYKLVREQSRRLSRCRLTFIRRTGRNEEVVNGAFVRQSILPSNPDDRQASLWQEQVTLDEGFYESLTQHPLPLREAAIRELSNKSMALDLYIWLAYRLWSLKGPIPLHWGALHGQFGAGYSRLAHFKRPFGEALKLAKAVYPEADVDLDDGKGVTLRRSSPPVVELHRRLGRD